jgi:hypothetical protein
MEEDSDDGAVREDGVDYSSEMGGGASSTGRADAYNPSARVRSVYDRSTDEPGSFDEGERPREDETLI